MITCITIDDEPLALKQMNDYIKKIPVLNLEESFTSALKALEFLQKSQVDLMFVDIHMPDLSGMELVRSLSDPPKAIFTTAYREFAVEGFQVDAADYLLKPISFPVFAKAVNKTVNRYFGNLSEEAKLNHNDQFLYIKTEYRIVRIDFKSILYIEGMRDYVRIHLEGQKPVMALLKMKKILEHLPPENFMRVHRSYIVNLNKVRTIERSRIVFAPHVYIPVSDQYKEDFQRFLDENFLR
jgi:DNA-binding LytR/AlgR family response regulator